MNVRTCIVVVAAGLMMGPAARAASDEPIVSVRTQPLKREEISQTVTCYGVLARDVGNTVAVSVPRPGQITRLFIALGQRVREEEPLFELTTSPEAMLQYKQAVSTEQYAREELQRTESLAAQHLATASQVAAARTALTQAEEALDAQKRLGAQDSAQTVPASFAGVVSGLSVKQGDRVQMGTTVVELSREGDFQVRLGLEPENITAVKIGMPVRITAIFDGKKSVEARIEKINGLINPQTRLVDVVTTIRGPEARGWITGMQVRGDVQIARETAWVVPREAVLRDGSGAYIFQVARGHAIRVPVRTTIETDSAFAIAGAVDPGLRVVVLGNYELADGKAVREMSP